MATKEDYIFEQRALFIRALIEQILIIAVATVVIVVADDYCTAGFTMFLLSSGIWLNYISDKSDLEEQWHEMKERRQKRIDRLRKD